MSANPSDKIAAASATVSAAGTRTVTASFAIAIDAAARALLLLLDVLKVGGSSSLRLGLGDIARHVIGYSVDFVLTQELKKG